MDPPERASRYTLLSNPAQLLGDRAFTIIRSVSLKMLNVDHVIVNINSDV